MDGPTFFSRLSELLADNPPHPADAPMLARLAELGVRPGSRDPPAGCGGGNRGRALGRAGAAAAHRRGARTPARSTAGRSRRGLGDYGTDYARRAHVALIGLGANLDADAVYPHATVDSQGRPLSGGHGYRLHFPPGQLPPVRGFWSLTLYNDKQFFVDNPIDRYALGDRDDLAYGRTARWTC